MSQRNGETNTKCFPVTAVMVSCLLMNETLRDTPADSSVFSVILV